MFHWWCWLFGSCVAATPAPAVAPPPPPAVHAPPVPQQQGVQAPPAEPAIAAPPPAVPEPPETPRLALAAPPPKPAATSPPATGAPPAVAPAGPPAWRRHAVAAPPDEGKPTLALVIDEMGVNVAQSARAITLPGPLTLAWLPYAPHLGELAAAGAAHGDETMLNMPMEGLGRADPGPDALRTWLPPATNLKALRAALDAVPDVVGLDPHEGSVATLSVPLMDLVMDELKARGLAFLDGRTIPRDVALDRAEAAGIPAAARDLCIDTDPNPAAIRARLADGEEIARRAGHAILIARARPATLDVLEQYLPTVAGRGFVLWPFSATIAAETRSAAAPPAAPARATAEVGEPAVAPPPTSGAE